MYDQIFKFFRAFHSNEKPWQLTLGLVFGYMMGLSPTISALNLVLFLLALIINLNISFLVLSLGFFSGVGYLLDPFFHKVGYHLLTSPELKEFWLQLFSSPITIIAQLNNSIVMGSLVICIISSIPMFLAFNILLKRYRDPINRFISRLPIIRSLKFMKIDTKQPGKTL